MIFPPGDPHSNCSPDRGFTTFLSLVNQRTTNTQSLFVLFKWSFYASLKRRVYLGIMVTDAWSPVWWLTVSMKSTHEIKNKNK